MQPPGTRPGPRLARTRTLLSSRFSETSPLDFRPPPSDRSVVLLLPVRKFAEIRLRDGRRQRFIDVDQFVHLFFLVSAHFSLCFFSALPFSFPGYVPPQFPYRAPQNTNILCGKSVTGALMTSSICRLRVFSPPLYSLLCSGIAVPAGLYRLALGADGPTRLRTPKLCFRTRGRSTLLNYLTHVLP